MIGNSRAPAETCSIAKFDGAGNPAKCRDDAIPANADIVSNLAEIVDLGAFADHRVVERAAINRRVRPDADVILHDHPAEMRLICNALSTGDHTESGLANPAPDASDT